MIVDADHLVGGVVAAGELNETARMEVHGDLRCLNR
jgi:hypothetical protein